ncbi:MAG TPA: PilZ domain-containing protein [Terriglobales bacterium]|nr:PilZ domain-containing protein [Terriglobales bacterium]
MKPQVLEVQRRSSRVPVSVPVLVTTLNPGTHFSEICETLVVSAHGCAFRSPLRLEKDAPIHLHSEEGRQTRAKVVSCQPLGASQQGWLLGASLERPENFWGLKSTPKDWVLQLPAVPSPSTPKLAAKTDTVADALTQEVISLKQQLQGLQKQLSNGNWRQEIAASINPLHAQIAELKNKLSDGKRSRFEVSLSKIPPELEEQLWLRLRKELGAQILRQTLEQSEQVLGAAREAIDNKITEAQQTFQQRLQQELHAVEERMRGVLTDSAARVRQHIALGLEQFEQRGVAAGNAIEQRGEELLQTLSQRLSEEHEAHRWQTQQLQKAVAEESSRLQAQISDLRDRVSLLDEAARRLEADFERRLTQKATEIASGAHAQLESAVQALLTEAETRNAKELSDQLDQACDHLKIIQKGVETSVAETLRSRTAEQLDRFQRTTEDLVQESGKQWRQRLAAGLNSVVNILGEQFREQEAPQADTK